MKFIRESDWGCLCDGRYLLLEQIEMWSEISDIYNVEPGLGKYLKLLPIQYYNNITITSFIQHQEPEPEISKNVGNIVGSGEISVNASNIRY